MPSTATARVRELSRGGRRKNDVIDAAAAASVAALQGDANPVVAEDLTTVLALLDERRDQPDRAADPAGQPAARPAAGPDPRRAPTDLTATAASRLLTSVRPAGPVETARKQLARDLVAEIRDGRPPARSCSRPRCADGRRARQPAARGRRHRPGRRRPAARPHPPAPAGSRPPRRSPATPASPRSRWPAPTGPGIGCPAAGTGSSTSPCTSSRSPRSACAAAPAAPTTTARSPPARPTTRRCAASNGAWPTTSGDS